MRSSPSISANLISLRNSQWNNFVIYLSVETGNLESAKEIAEAGKAILKSGGIGIKVESAGKAFDKKKN